MSSTPPPRLPATGFVLLAALGLFWGLNWPAIKISVAEIPVWWFRSISVGAGAVGILAIAAMTAPSIWPRRRELPQMLACMIFAVLGWHLGTGFGVALMPAGRAAIIAYMMPVFAALLAVPVLKEPLTPTKIIGLMLGVAGLAVLMGPDIIKLQKAPLGVLFMLGAAVSWAAGTVLFKMYRWDSPITVLIGWQFLAGFVVMTPIAILLQPFPDIAALKTETWAAMIYLIALPMIFCQWAYLKVVSLFPAGIAAIGTLAVPIVGVFSSALILGEPVGWREILAMALIIAALVVVMILPALRASAQRRRDRTAGSTEQASRETSGA